MARAVILRLFGLAMAAVLAAAAVALLTFGLDAETRTLAKWLETVSEWLVTPQQEGQQALIAAGTLLVGLLTLVLIFRRPKTNVKRLAKTSEGTTSVDLASVAWVTQRMLRDEIDANVNVRADGTKRVTAVVPVYAGGEPLASVDEIAVALPAILDALGAPPAHRVVTGSLANSRVR